MMPGIHEKHVKNQDFQGVFDYLMVTRHYSPKINLLRLFACQIKIKFENRFTQIMLMSKNLARL